jgi:hypothetical protein
MIRAMTPFLIAVVLGAGLLALLPTMQLARRTSDRSVLTGYLVALWLTLAVVAAAPGLRRFAIPLAIILAIAPWLTLRAGLERLLRRRARPRRPPPRNVTPPDGGPGGAR